MKCTEYFYKEENAIDFLRSIDSELNPEMVKTVDEDCGKTVWVIYYNAPRVK